MDKSSYNVSEIVTIYATITNQGTASASNVMESVYIDGYLWTSGGGYSLSPGESTTRYTTWTATVGSHTLRWNVDPSNAISESNENNNYRETTITVQQPSPSLPDLTVLTLSSDKSSYNVGDNVIISATVKNQGNAAASNIIDDVYVDGSRWAIGGGYSLSPSESTTRTTTWTATAGTHTVKWTVDPGNAISESNENNNYRETTITVQQPSPSVSSFSINSGASTTTSQTVTLNNVCLNSPTQYMASESSSFSGATWQTYSTAPTFTLSSGNGVKTVYFKVKNGYGESSVVSGTITLSISSAQIISTTTDKPSYSPGDTVVPTVTVKNTGGTALTVRINVDIADPSGTNVKVGVFASSVSLNPGEQKSVSSPYWTIPSNAQEGTYQITVGVYDSSSGQQYDIKYRVASFTITVINTSITIQIQPSSTVNVGDAIEVWARLFDSSSHVVLGRTLKFYVAGQYVGGGSDTSTGWVKVTYTVNLSPGSYTVMVVFDGDSTYAASNNTAALVVQSGQKNTSIILQINPSSTVLTGDSITILGRLKDSDNNIVLGKTLKFYVAGQYVGQDNNPSTGWCQVSYSVSQAPGSYEVKVTFDGDSSYTASQNTATLVVQSRSAQIVSVTTDKPSYSPGDTVVPTVTVKNTGGTALTVRINVDIADPSGTNVKAGVFASSVSLNPGEQKSVSSPYWTIPSNAQEGTYQITVGVYDSSTAQQYDIAYRIKSFTISGVDQQRPSVQVISPNGGETWNSGETKTITWTASDNVGVTRIALYYSTDGGGSWSTIATNLGNSGSYSWQVPNVSSTNAFVRVEAFDAAGNSNSDVSNNPFSIQFGLSPSISSFSINSGASTTTSQTVTLNNVCLNSPTQYMASESSSFSGATWQTYSTAPTFTLSSGNGVKTVYFKVKNSYGESSAVSATITLSITGDAYEPDNSFTQFSPITVTTTLQSQSRSIEPAGDNDYIRFYVTSNNYGRYTFYTQSSINTYGHLYDSSQNQLAYNDDSGGNYQFRIDYNISSTGYYYLRVRGYSSSVQGPYTLYFQYQPIVQTPSVSSFSINSGASTTTSQTVTLNNVCLNSPTQYMASESSSFSGATWQTYSTAPTFTLSSGNGVKTVYFKVKNSYGESSMVSDTITLSISSAQIISTTTDKSSYSPSDTVVPTVTVKNTGGTAITIRINVYIADPSGTNVKAGVFASSVSLNPGEQKSVSSPYWTIPSNAQEGTYQITVGVYDASSGQQYDIAYRIKSFTITKLPSLQVTLSASSTTTTSGGSITIVSKVTASDGKSPSVGYSWSATGGSLNFTTSAAVIWNAPSVSSSTTYKISLTASASGYTSGSRDIYVTVQPSISAQIITFTPATGTYRPGDLVVSTLTFKNTGSSTWTFYVGYSVYDPNGKHNDTTSVLVTLDPGQTSSAISRTWVVPTGAANGYYDVAMVVWSYSPENNPSASELASKTAQDSFQVTEFTGPSPEQYKPSIMIASAENSLIMDYPKVYYYGPIPDNPDLPRNWIIEYWFYFPYDSPPEIPQFAEKKLHDWEPVFVLIDSSGRVLDVFSTLHYSWTAWKTLNQKMEFRDNTHVIIKFNEGWHTPWTQFPGNFEDRGYGYSLSPLTIEDMIAFKGLDPRYPKAWIENPYKRTDLNPQPSERSSIYEFILDLLNWGPNLEVGLTYYLTTYETNDASMDIRIPPFPGLGQVTYYISPHNWLVYASDWTKQTDHLALVGIPKSSRNEEISFYITSIYPKSIFESLSMKEAWNEFCRSTTLMGQKKDMLEFLGSEYAKSGWLGYIRIGEAPDILFETVSAYYIGEDNVARYYIVTIPGHELLKSQYLVFRTYIDKDGPLFVNYLNFPTENDLKTAQEIVKLIALSTIKSTIGLDPDITLDVIKCLLKAAFSYEATNKAVKIVDTDLASKSYIPGYQKFW
jgi:uncharacterized protein YcfL